MGENIFGKDVTLRYSQNNAIVVTKVKSARVEEIGDTVADEINGDDRAEFQTVIDGYQITIECYTQDSTLIDALLANRANEDAQTTQLVKAFGIRFQFHDGTKKAYVASEMTLDPMTLDIAGRKDRVMVPIKFRARRFLAAGTTA